MNHKVIIIAALIFFVNLSAIAQKRLSLSKEIATATYNFSDYTALDVASDFEIQLNFSENREEITVEANSNLLEMVNITKEGNTLVFRLENGLWNINGNMILNVTIYTKPIINSFKLASDAVVNLNDQLVQDNLTLDLKSDSVFSGDLQVDAISLRAKSDAVITLSGSANEMNASLSSDSELRADRLTIQDVKIKLSGDSEARINVVRSMEASASGDSMLRYAGNPGVQKKKSSGDAEIISVN